MWHDGVWERDEYLDAVEEELRLRQIERLGPSALGYDDGTDWKDSIESTVLSQGTIMALHGEGIHTIEQLKELTDDDLLKVKGIGKARVAEIREALEDL